MHMKSKKLVFFLSFCMTATATVMCCHERNRKLYLCQIKFKKEGFTYEIQYEQTFHQKQA